MFTTTASVYGATWIGRSYSELDSEGMPKPVGERIDYVSHKMLHGLLGGAIGAVRGDILAGALGGITSELIAEMIQEDADKVAERIQEQIGVENIEEDSPNLQNLINQELTRTINWARMGAAITTLLTGHDVNVSVEAATNALENNFAKMIGQAIVSLLSKKTAQEGIKQVGKSAAKDSVRKAAKEKSREGFSEETKRLLGKTNKRYKEQLLERPGKAKDQTTLQAAQKELKGEQIDLAKQRGAEYNHIEKVESAQRGLLDHIGALKNRLGFPRLPDVERQALQHELSKASKLLDQTEKFVPR